MAMGRMGWKSGAAAAGAAVLWIISRAVLDRAFSTGDVPPTNFSVLRLSHKPNQYLLCPPGFCGARPHGESPRWPLAADALAARLKSLALSEPRVSLAREDAGSWQYSFVQRSLIFRFPDIVTVQAVALDERTSALAVYSRSVYGHSDLGVNRRRVERWLRLLKQEG